MSQLIYSISEVFSDKFLNSNNSNWKFIIPDYQRGYKWGSQPIKKLLNDIDKFDLGGDDEKFYCLNNLTLVEHHENQTIEYHVVDGQQRLTTITVILACLKNLNINGLPNFENKIEYKIRVISQDFIEKIINNQSIKINGNDISFHDLFKEDNNVSWSDFVKYNEDCDYQDIYYLFNAYKTVFQWLNEHKSSSDFFIKKFLNHVKLIVNNVPDIESEATLFGNLNSNKVPLDGSDLVRALIITNVAKVESENFEDPLKRKIHINERRIRIGLQIDSIMHWWKDVDHQQYYQIITNAVKVDRTDNIEFDENKNPINHLYKLYSLIYNNGTISLACFENDIVRKWERILHLQRVLEQWYNDNKLYHAVGFVLQNSDKDKRDQSFSDIFDNWNNPNSTIGGFYKFLLMNIKDIITNYGLQLTLDDASDTYDQEYKRTCFEENWYDDEHLIPIMILLDIISEEKNGRRIPVKLFKQGKEDKEHIFPQTPLGAVTNQKDISGRKCILTSYIELVNKNINDEDKISLNKSIDDWTKNEMMSKELDNLQNEINDKIKKVIPINCLGNICLLDQKINRSYGNDFYTAKRLDIVHHYFNSDSIRPHVIEAFDKSWLERDPKTAPQAVLNSWNTDDIINRRKFIIKSIKLYLENNWK